MSNDSLARRLVKAETQLGIFSDSEGPESSETLTATIARLQSQVHNFIQKHPVLHKLPEILVEFGTNTSDEPVEDDVSMETKQEVLLAQYPMMLESFNLLVEFSTMKIPDLQEGVMAKLELADIGKHREALLQLAADFELLVSKNLLVLHKFTDLVERQTRYWLELESRLVRVSRDLSEAEKLREF